MKPPAQVERFHILSFLPERRHNRLLFLDRRASQMAHRSVSELIPESPRMKFNLFVDVKCLF